MTLGADVTEVEADPVKVDIKSKNNLEEENKKKLCGISNRLANLPASISIHKQLSKLPRGTTVEKQAPMNTKMEWISEKSNGSSITTIDNSTNQRLSSSHNSRLPRSKVNQVFVSSSEVQERRRDLLMKQARQQLDMKRTVTKTVSPEEQIKRREILMKRAKLIEAKRVSSERSHLVSDGSRDLQFQGPPP